MKLTGVQYDILILLEGCDLYYPFSHFDVNLSRKELSKEFKILREAGLVDFSNGLMTEDCEVAGSGYGIKVGADKKIRELLNEWEENNIQEVE
tara:strand:- start:107 stop:385 length:279 start_codon:yes stop_codon:yes gene_type:complete